MINYKHDLDSPVDCLSEEELEILFSDDWDKYYGADYEYTEIGNGLIEQVSY